VERVAEASIAGVAGEHDLAGAGGAGIGGAGVALACLGVEVAVRVVAELVGDLGGQDRAEPGWLA
jgi:hypothetical protein